VEVVGRRGKFSHVLNWLSESLDVEVWMTEVEMVMWKLYKSIPKVA
jgi:hypothetical protein